MPDVFTKRKRSEVMSRIRGRGNKATEVALAKLLRKHRITGWRRNQSVLGKPDFVFRRQQVAVFVDGCFWHACPKHSNMPANNRAFWKKKLTANKARQTGHANTPLPRLAGAADLGSRSGAQKDFKAPVTHNACAREMTNPVALLTKFFRRLPLRRDHHKIRSLDSGPICAAAG